MILTKLFSPNLSCCSQRRIHQSQSCLPSLSKKTLSSLIKPKSVKKINQQYPAKKTFLDLLQEQKYFHNLKIKAYLHNSLNLSKSVVRSIYFSLCTLDKIKSNLCKQGITDAKRISIKRNNQIISTNTYILNFNTPKSPNEIKIGYLITKVETYIPNLLRCHNCQRFGHHKEKCTRPPTCKNCGKNGNHLDYQQTPKCANCKENHLADSKECKLSKKRILEVKHTKNISYPEARKFIENSLATTTYAKIAKPTKNYTQNQVMMTNFNMMNLIKELKTLLELLRESLTNSTTKPHAGPDPKKNLHPHNNEAEGPK